MSKRHWRALSQGKLLCILESEAASKTSYLEGNEHLTQEQGVPRVKNYHVVLDWL